MFKRRERRRSVRRDVRWPAAYAVEKPSSSRVPRSEWRPCSVANISMGGVRLDLFDADVNPGDRVVVDLLGPGIESLRVAGVVLQKTRTADGDTWIAVAFADVGDIEQTLKRRLQAAMQRDISELDSFGR